MEGGGVCVVVCIGIGVGARVLFVHEVDASPGRGVQMSWLGVDIMVGI